MIEQILLDKFGEGANEPSVVDDCRIVASKILTHARLSTSTWKATLQSKTKRPLKL